MRALSLRQPILRTLTIAAMLVAWTGCANDDDGRPAPAATATQTDTVTATPPSTSTPQPSDTPTSPPTATATPNPTSTATPSEQPTATETATPDMMGAFFVAPLAGAQEVPPVETDASGVANITLSQDESTLSFELSVNGIDPAQITQAHIHVGPPGFNGPVVLFLAAGSFQSPISGTLTEADLIANEDVGVTTFAELVERLQAGEAYVNVHTMANPGGEVRGQIPVATRFVANLSGDQEVPPVDSAGTGSSNLTLSADESSIDFVLDVSGIDSSDITQAHIHIAPSGFNGPVVLFLAASSFESPISGTLTEDDLIARPDSGIESFADVVAAMRDGHAYVNVHTMANPGGEVRGQIQAPVALPVVLDGEQEVPPVQTDAGGTARIAIDADNSAIRFAVAVNGLSPEEITQAHIHVAPVGFNGPVTVFLADSGFGPLRMGALTADELIPNVDAGVNDFTQLIQAIRDGEAYINVHTQANPPGEIRGQIDAPITLPVTLSGDEEVPPVDSEAGGFAQLTIDAQRQQIRYIVEVQGIEASEITQAHIHIAPRGINGPVVMFLADSGFTLRQGVLTAEDLLPRSDVGVETFGELLEAIFFGDAYVNVHSMTNLAGEIRGQVQVPVALPTELSGAAEVPPVETEGMGRARLVLNADETALAFALTVSGLETSQITQAHVHVGPADMNGPVVLFLADAPFAFRRGRLTADNFIPVDGVATFADLLDRLRAGGTYVNVHTMQNMDGEVRGQLRAPITFVATLSGDAEVPPVDTEASGRAQVVLGADRDLLRFALAVQNLPSDQITQAHIHVGTADVNGPVVFFLADGPFTSPRIGNLDAENLIPQPGVGVESFADFVARLQTGETYVNVHTQQNMDGEVRGQLLQ